MKPADEYILKQAPQLQEIILFLCAVVEQTVPDAELLFKWKLPFYYYQNKPFCYINTLTKQQAVDLCFYNGYKISVHQNLMISENRKMVTSLRYNDLIAIDVMVLKEVLLQAVLLH